MIKTRVSDPDGFYPDLDSTFEKKKTDLEPDQTFGKKSYPLLTLEKKLGSYLIFT